MQQERVVETSPRALKQFLNSKGIALVDIQGAIAEAIAAYNETTKNDPAVYRGTLITAKTTSALRRRLAVNGFEKEAPSNIELTVNKDNGFAIHAVRGCPQTGMPAGKPATNREKGEKSRSFFGLETGEPDQIDMFADQLPSSISPGCKYDAWFLMLYPVIVEGEGLRLRAELSKPSHCSQKGVVNGFSMRYVIGMDDFNTALLVDPSENPEEGYSDEIEFDISLNE